MSHDDRPRHLAHHYDSLQQQFNAAKLGMWLFLATEVLLFGGLFCAYAVLRGNRPEMFEYGSQYLDVSMGATNTVILILSSLTMAMAVSAAQLGKTRRLCILLGLTILGGVGFMSIKFVEYSHKFEMNLMWGVAFYEPPQIEHHEALLDGSDVEVDEGTPVEVGEQFTPDLALGTELWMASCKQCHGTKGEGVPGQGLDQRGSEFIAGLSDDQLLRFIKIGRTPFDPLSRTGIQMPPRGGNLLLRDDELRHIIAYMRTIEEKSAGDMGGAGGDDDFFFDFEPVEITSSVIQNARSGPAGLDVMALDSEESSIQASHDSSAPHLPPQLDPDRPKDLHQFFGIYFLMTGLHGIHVLLGMAVISWLLFKARQGTFGPDYFTPVDLVGLYWHVVDLIWIFLFPLFYLIG